jgi:GDPmannose 4,6-dehydratase
MKRALICGITGQDGAYLSQLLLEKGYEVFGTSRDAENTIPKRLSFLGIVDKIKIYSASLIDFRSIIRVLQLAKPDEIYNLSGQSSVSLSFDQPVETFNSIALGTLNLLEAVRLINPQIKVYNAASSECFGDTKGLLSNEQTLFSPRSPYAVAKAAAFWSVSNYREAYNLFSCSGILFNHESPLRPERFVTQKIISTVIKIARGQEKMLELGNIEVNRDWGWAPEYVNAMYLMLQSPRPSDYVISTGKVHQLKEFISLAFSYFNLNWEEFVVIKEGYKRPLDLETSVGDPSKAKRELGWEAQSGLQDIIQNMIEYKLKSVAS